MKIKGLALLSLALAIALAIFAFVTAGRLPEGAMLPTHWNAAGEVDRSSPALQALLMPPALILFITGIPPTEAQSLRSRGDAYRDYQRTTSPLIPWFPRKSRDPR